MKVEEIAAQISNALAQHGLDGVLVGGACVSLYSHNKYQSSDLDFVSHGLKHKIKAAMAHIGFTEKGRYFVREGCPFFIDFVAPPLAIGQDPVREVSSLNTSEGPLKLLTPTDCVKDRLAAYYHWDDRQSLEQAVMVAKAQAVDINDIGMWSNREGHPDKFQTFVARLHE